MAVITPASVRSTPLGNSRQVQTYLSHVHEVRVRKNAVKDSERTKFRLIEEAVTIVGAQEMITKEYPEQFEVICQGALDWFHFVNRK